MSKPYYFVDVKKLLCEHCHRDDSTRDGKENLGNFQVLLDFRIDSGDHVLEKHFTIAAKNATYI